MSTKQTKPQGKGRPRVSDKRTSIHVGMRCSERMLFLSAAEAKGLDLASWLRLAAHNQIEAQSRDAAAASKST